MLDKALVCTDGSEEANKAVLFAARMLGGSECRTTLLMVMDREGIYPPLATDGMLYPEVMLSPPQELEEALEERARAILEKAEGVLREASLETQSKAVWGSAAREIIKEAGEGSYDLVIVGRHGHGLLKGFLIGSVSDRVVRHSPCPVLVVH